jgi:hypothetical protein
MQYIIILSEYKLKFEMKIYLNNVIVINFNKFEIKFQIMS